MKTRYDSMKLSPDGLAKVTRLKNDAEILATTIDNCILACRERSLAHTELQAAVMWATRAIALQEAE